MSCALDVLRFLGDIYTVSLESELASEVSDKVSLLTKSMMVWVLRNIRF